jgi:uncharacterized protein YjbI with pentapeptide repeats
MYRSHLEGGNFSSASVDGATFNQSDLMGAFFYSARLRGAAFINSELYGVRFSGANLNGGSFRESLLAGAEFGWTNLNATSFEKGNIAGASFFAADLSKSKALDFGGLAEALGDTSTKLPEGMNRPPSWPDREVPWKERFDMIERIRAAKRNETGSSTDS